MKDGGMQLDIIEKVMIGGVIVLVSVVLLTAVVQPYFEARTFNKFSATKATWLDAFVSELRVMPQEQ